jgi:hypothetical protein
MKINMPVTNNEIQVKPGLLATHRIRLCHSEIDERAGQGI